MHLPFPLRFVFMRIESYFGNFPEFFLQQRDFSKLVTVAIFLSLEQKMTGGVRYVRLVGREEVHKPRVQEELKWTDQ